MDTVIGFIILRHVNSAYTNQHWIKSYDSVRQYYPENPIVIIDDNSDKTFLTSINLYNTTIINSEFPKRGELLPYYYYLKNKFFDVAVIIHDSVFINSNIDFSVEKYKILWEFEHMCDDANAEKKILSIFNDQELIDFYDNKNLWKGCFGGMTVIRHDFLTDINKKYDISKLLDCILCRRDRMYFERVIACILQKEAPNETMFGNIHKYVRWGISFNDIRKYNHLPIIKVWCGR
jgi:hypothetical protein